MQPQIDLFEVHTFLSQFGAHTLRVRQNILLCVPSIKTHEIVGVPSLDYRALLVLGTLLVLTAVWWAGRRMTSTGATTFRHVGLVSVCATD